MSRKYFINLDFFEKIDSELKAYLLGWMYSDGQVSVRGNYFSIALHKDDREILDLFCKAFNYTGKLYINKNCNKEPTCLRLYLNSKKIVNDLVLLGCFPNKTYKLNFPTEEQVPTYLINHFIRGFFDGDGSVMIRRDKSACFSICGTFSMVKTIRNWVIKSLKINKIKITRVKLKKNGKFLYLFNFCNKIGPNCYAKKIYGLLYNDSNFYLSRKRNKFLKILSLCKEETDNKFIECKDSESNVYYIHNKRHKKELSEKLSFTQQGIRKKNGMESSKYMGVCKRGKNSYLTSVRKNGVNYCSIFKEEKEAAQMYDKMIIYLYGRDGRLNFNQEIYNDEQVKEAFLKFIGKLKASV